MKDFVVYCHKLHDGRRYIGITCQNVNRRWRNGDAYSNNTHFYRAIQKYGWDAFTHEILFRGLTEEEAKAKERELIKKYKTQDRRYGFNQTGGGDGICNPSEETRRKIGEWSRRVNTGRKHTEEYKRYMSKRMKDNNPNARGKLLTEERIEKFREYAKKPKTETQKKKMSESAKKHKVYCVETGEVYDSIKAAAEKLGACYPAVSSALYRGNRVKGVHIKSYQEKLNG